MRQLKITQSYTSRESPSLEKYFQDIGKIALLTPEEEVALAQRIKQGDEEALEHLWKANLRFVVSIAKQYQNQGLALSDLISEGNIGLKKAAVRFDETRGFKFISYAVWRIRQHILLAISEQSQVIKPGTNESAKARKIGKARSKLLQNLEREPTPEELAEELDRGVEKIDRADSLRTVSLDAPIGFADGAASLVDVLSGDSPSPDSEIIADGMTQEVESLLKSIKGRERQIVVLYLGLEGNTPMSREDLASELGVSTTTAQNDYSKALRKIRRKIKNGQGENSNAQSYL